MIRKIWFRDNGLLYWAFIFLFCCFTLAAYAAPAPNPPSRLYRADTRTPDQIFGPRERSGPGFVTWAAARGVPENPSVLAYLSGETVAPAPESQRNAGWVSATGSLFGVMQYLNDELIRRGNNLPTTLHEYWVYEMAPTADAYSVNWMLDEVSASPESRAQIAAIMSLLGYRTENEWIIRGGVPPQHIQRAVRYRYRFDIATGFGAYEQDTRPGSVVENPHFIAPPFPSPQTSNPLSAERVPPAVYGYAYGGGTATLQEDSMDEYDDFAFGCGGAGASGFSSSRVQSSVKAPPPAPGCDYSSKGVVKYVPQDLPTVKSKLVIGYTVTQNLCLSPTNERTSSLENSRSYLYADFCDKGSYQEAIYDSYQRIVFPKDYFAIPVCVTAPENVISGSDTWDWVHLWPCDIKNPYQKWIVAKGKFRPYLNPKLSMQLYKYHGIISKSSGPEVTLNTSKIPKNFFKQFSKPTTSWYEVGMSFNSNGRYYPNSAYIYAGKYYQHRTYYDVENKRLVLLEFYQRAFSADGWQMKCLNSYLTGYQSWNWADWIACNPYEASVPMSQKWFFKQQSKNPVTSVLIKDSKNNGLYVNLNSSVNWGRLFVSGSAISPSTPFFDLLRIYGVCLKPDGTWFECVASKHTTSENDG